MFCYNDKKEMIYLNFKQLFNGIPFKNLMDHSLCKQDLLTLSYSFFKRDLHEHSEWVFE